MLDKVLMFIAGWFLLVAGIDAVKAHALNKRATDCMKGLNEAQPT